VGLDNPSHMMTYSNCRCAAAGRPLEDEFVAILDIWHELDVE
jgi:hypothetical protein